MLKKFIKGAAVALAISCSAMPVYAAVEQHEGDIQPWKSNGQIFTNGTLFESDFGDLSGGLYVTDDPGYDTNTTLGALGVGNWLQLEALGVLKYWNGSTWANSVPNGEHIEIEDALGNITTFSATGVTNPFAVIGEADDEGGVHEHIDMSIRNALNDLGGSTGAYWISFRLLETAPNSTTPVSLASDPISLVFNRGLSEVDFEASVSAVNPVPVPAAFWLFGSALAGYVSTRRRRKAT